MRLAGKARERRGVDTDRLDSRERREKSDTGREGKGKGNIMLSGIQKEGYWTLAGKGEERELDNGRRNKVSGH